MVLSDEEYLKKLAMDMQIGDALEKFKNSPGYDYFQAMCEAEIALSHDRLSTVDPVDVKAITSLQNQVWRAREFMHWLDAGIEIGNQAYRSYQEEFSEN